MTPPPIALGLTICDYAIVEEITKKATLVGDFLAVRAPIFPSPPRSFCAYSLLTAGLGEGTIELAITCLDDEEELVSLVQTGSFPGRLAFLRVLFRIREFSFPGPGTYEVALLVDGELIASRRVRAYLEGNP